MYRLRFPFRSTHEVTNFTEQIPLGSSGVDASVQPHLPYVVLNLENFRSETAAADALPFAWGAVMLASVLAGWGFHPEAHLDKTVYTDDPEAAAANLEKNLGLPNRGPVHGLVNGNLPAVIATDKNIRFLTANPVGVIQSLPISRIIPFLERALSFDDAARGFADERLRLALDLWRDYHGERSIRAKFLTLVMILEVLAPSRLKDQVAQDIVARWDSELSVELDRYPSQSPEYEAIESLRREVVFRRERSIRSRIRQYALAQLSGADQDHALAIAEMAVRAYDLRGTLLHTGAITPAELSDAHAAALRSVRVLILSRFGIPDPRTAMNSRGDS